MSKEDTLSLSEEAHINILSLLPILYLTLGSTLFTLLILFSLVLSWQDMDRILRQYGSFENALPPGKFIPFDSQQFPTNLLNEVLAYQVKIQLIIMAMVAVVIVFTIYFFLHVTKKIKNLEEWDTNYAKQSYFLVFQTTIPVGDTMGEKIYHLAKHVYPELRSDRVLSNPSILEKIEWQIWRFIGYMFRRKRETEQERLSKALNYGTDSYVLDLVLRTKHGFFIVKYFGNKKVELNDLNELIKIVKRKFSLKMWFESKSSRVICVAKKYDPEILPRLKALVTSEINVDLLIEEENGFSVLWIG